jgi:SulP family sulfate permease
MGIIQIVAGALRLGLLMKFVSRSVMAGFVNAPAILILLAQMPRLMHVGRQTYAMVAAGIGERPCPAGFTIFSGINLWTAGDMDEFPSSLPFFAIPQVPLNLELLKIVLPSHWRWLRSACCSLCSPPRSSTK